MSLSLEGRWCGKVYVARCVGRIVTGQESVLEANLNRAMLDTNRIVLNAAEVARIDSVGMGLLVRLMTKVRGRAGDLRLAAPPPFMSSLLQMTRLHTVFHIYDSEDDAIVSFLNEPVKAGAEPVSAGPIVLFVDQSADLCAFFRKLLIAHGYQVLSSCRLHDAKLLLGASKVAYVILGPDCSAMSPDQVMASLKPFVKSAPVLQLEKGFNLHDADHAGTELLRRLEAASGAHA